MLSMEIGDEHVRRYHYSEVPMRERILIVEDDKHISKLVKFNLEKADYECTIAATGEKALEILNDRSSELIILDIMLPGMDGFGI